MKTWLKVAGGLVLLLYFAMCFLAKLDGGASNGMPSGSAEAAERSGMLVKRLTVLTDSGGPAGVRGAWIEIAAATTYRFGFLAQRKALLRIGGDTTWLLAVDVPRDVHLGENRAGSSGKDRLLEGGRHIEGFDLVRPLPDTIHLQARRAGEFGYPVVFADGRSVWDAGPKRN